MEMRLFNILFVLLLTAFSTGNALADVKFDSFEAKPAAKAQRKSGAKSSARLSKPKGHPGKKQQHPVLQHKKLSKADVAGDTVKGEKEYLAGCIEKLRLHSLQNFQQSVSSTWQFTKEQADTAKMAALKAIRSGEKWAVKESLNGTVRYTYIMQCQRGDQSDS